MTDLEKQARDIETVDQLRERAAATRMVEIDPADRREFARALVLQGYDTPRAHRMAYDDCGDIQDNDGALQMLARHRLAFRDAQPGEGMQDRLRHVIDRDRYAAAAVLGAVDKAIQGRTWLSEPGRGSYAYDDERYQQEFGQALAEINEALRPLRALAKDKSDCTTDPEKVKAARAAGAEHYTELAKPRPDREAVWLIERPNPPREVSPHPVVYMLLDKTGGGHSWTADPQDASRFQNRADAETHIGNATGLRAAEHIFGLALLPAEPVQEMREGMKPCDGKAVPGDYAGEEVLLRNGTVTRIVAWSLRNFIWGNQDPSLDIIAYTPKPSLPSEDGWRPHFDYAGEPMREGEFRDPPAGREERHD